MELVTLGSIMQFLRGWFALLVKKIVIASSYNIENFFDMFSKQFLSSN